MDARISIGTWPVVLIDLVLVKKLEVQGFKILLSVPASSLFMFSRCRIITISGIAVAAMSSGHRFTKSQLGVRIIAKIKTSGKVTEAPIDAKDTYRHIKTTTTHIATENEAQIV